MSGYRPFGLLACDGWPAASQVGEIVALYQQHPWLWGAYVGDDEDEIAAMTGLTCSRLIHAPTVADLAEQIGQVLRGLWRR